MRMGCNRKSNLIQQTHILIYFVSTALLATEEGKENEMNKAELFPARRSLSSGGASYKDLMAHTSLW